MILELNNFGFFKKKMSMVNNILNETNFIFKEEGLYLSDVDIKNEILVHLFFCKKYFINYYFTRETSFRVNLLDFYNCLKTITSQNKLILKFNNNYLEIIGEKKLKTQKYIINLVEEKVPNLIKSHFNINYNNVFKLEDSNNNIFHINEFQLSEVSIKIKDKKIIISTKNEDIEINKEISGIKFEKFTEYDIKSNYCVEHIKKASKFLNILKKNTISMNNNSPLRIESLNEDFLFIIIISNIKQLIE